MRQLDVRRRPINGHLMIAVAAIAMAAIGCAWNPPPVPVFASRADWEALAGRWSGSYSTSSANRRGLIDFTLSASDAQAFGDVLMIAEGTRTPYRPFPPGDPRIAHIDTSYTQMLTITFVRAEQGQINGTIASYWDPDRNCEASATFLGTVQNRAIEGTFTSVCKEGVRHIHGAWRVTRQPSAAR